MTRPRSIGTLTSLPAGASLPISASKASTSAAWMSTKKKFGARSGQAAGDLPAEIAVDQRQRHQQRQAEAERQHHRRRQRAGPVDVADRQPQRGRADARAPAGDPLHADADAAQHDEGEDRGADEDQRDAAVVREPDRQGRQHQRDQPSRRDIGEARQAAALKAHLAKQRGRRHVARAAERHQREGQRHQQPEQRRHRQSAPG